MNTKKYLIILASTIFIVASFLLAPSISFASCDGANMSLSDYTYFQSRGWVGATINVSGLTASAHFFNDTACNFPVSLASFKMFDRTRESQTLFSDSGVSTVNAHSSLNLSISLPNCMAQIDAYYGSAPSTPVGDDNINYAWAFSMNNGTRIGDASGNFCTNTPPPVSVVASCSATPSSVNVGGSIVWNSTATGGTGTYTYSWTGTDSLSGTNSSVSKTYSTSGTKTATITVTSGTQSATANCSATVINPSSNALVASCSVSPTSVNTGGTINWSGTTSGGTGSYTYSWSGTDSLSGSSSTTSKTYSSAGTKNGTITVTSGSDSATANCSAIVNTPGTPPTSPNNPSCTSNCGGGNGGGPIIVLGNSLNGYCVANPSTGKVGDPIIWSVYPSGGIGSYTYSWFGTDVYSNFSQSFGKIYSTPGPKTMTVIINSGSESITRTCSLDLGQVLAYTSLSSVYLSEVPYTGIEDLNNIWVFTIGLALWSALLAYYLQRRKGKMATEIVSAPVQKANVENKNALIFRNEMSEIAISEVENYARNEKAIISTEAVKEIVKNCFLHNGKTDVAVSEVISRARYTQNIAESDWIAIGEKDL